MRLHYIVIFYLGFYLNALSQSFKVVDNIKDFSAKTIYDIKYDKQGVLWIATFNEGLFKYDGINLTNFIDTANFCSYHSRRIYFDDDGIYNCTGNGLFKITANKMSPEIIFDSLKKQVTDLKKIGHNNYLMSTTVGLYIYSNKNIVPIDSSVIGINSKNIITSILKNSTNNQFYLTTRNGLFKVSNDLKKIIKIDLKESKNLKINEGIFIHDTLFFPTSNGLILVKNDKLLKTYNDSLFETKSINYIYKPLNKNYLWVFQLGKMYKYQNGKVLEKYTVDDGLTNFPITCVTEDKDGNLLIASNGGGLIYFIEKTIYNYNVGKTTNTFKLNDTSFYYSNKYGISLLNLKTKKTAQQINYDLHKINRELDFVVDKYKRIWLYTEENKLILLKNNLIVKQFDYDFIHPNPSLTKLYLDNNNTLWLSFLNGGESVNIDNYKLNKLVYSNRKFTSYIKTYKEIDENLYAYAGRNLFVKYPTDTVFFDFFKERLSVNAFEKDTKNNFWMFTTDEFLLFQKGNFTKFQKTLNFSTFKITSTSIYKNYLIAYAEGGIYIFDTDEYYKTGKLKSIKFDLKNTFNAYNITTPTNFIDSAGNLYFGTDNGIVKFNFINELQTNKYIKLHLSNILLDYELVNWDTLDYKTINNIPINPQFKHYQNNFTFQLSNLNFFNSNATFYQYRLIGLDKGFTKPTQINQINYSNLPYGKYEFVAKAFTDGFSKSTDVFIYKFEIMPAFYQTVWFKIAMIILLIILITIIFKYRTFKIQEKNKMLTKLVNQKTELLSKKIEESTELYNQIKSKNLTINESLEYAKYIQDSILKLNTDTIIHQNIKINEIIYLPKDIIGGDFYMIFSHNNINYIISADCTGHGVPGALLTVLCKSLLNQIILFDNIYEPNLILQKLNELLWSTFQNQKKAHNSADGLCLVVVALNYEKNSFKYSSSLQPFLITLADGTVKEIKSNSTALNINPQHAFYNDDFFNISDIKSLLLYSDGIVDQKGMNSKKLMSSGIKKWFIEENGTSYYSNKIENFKGNTYQRDDILLISIQLN